MHDHCRSAIRRVLVPALLLSVATGSCDGTCRRKPTGRPPALGATVHPSPSAKRPSPLDARDASSPVPEAQETLSVEQGALRVVVVDAGDEPKSTVRYRPVGTEARVRVDQDFPPIRFDVTLGPPRTDGSSWRVELSVASEYGGDPGSAPFPPSEVERPETHCAQCKLDALGRVQRLALSRVCERSQVRLPLQSRAGRPLVPFFFVVPWPDEPIGVGAEWTVSETIGANRRPFGKTQYTLLARRGGELLVAFSTHEHNKLSESWASGAPTAVSSVQGVARVDLTQWIPLARIAYAESPRPPSPWGPLSYREKVVPDWATGADDSLLRAVMAQLLSQRANVRWAAVRASAASPADQDIEPLLNASQAAAPRLRRAIEGVLATVTNSDARGLGDWFSAALEGYCTDKSATHELELLDEGLALPGSRRKLRATVLAQRGILRRAVGDLAGAAADFTEALKLDPRGTEPILSAAWWYVTAPEREQRNAAQALALLEKLDADSDGGSLVAQTRAAVLAELGRFDEASDRQKEARAASKSWDPPSWKPSVQRAISDVMLARENAYRNGHPWRDNWIPLEQNACRWYRYPAAPRP
jgi:hypothetical protein